MKGGNGEGGMEGRRERWEEEGGGINNFTNLTT